jgi:fucose permease
LARFTDARVQDAQANGYTASFKKGAATKMGVLHAVYGLGAMCSPLVSTQFSHMEHWSFHYLVSLGVALSNTVVLIAVFRLKTQDGMSIPHIMSVSRTSAEQFEYSRVHGTDWSSRRRDGN